MKKTIILIFVLAIFLTQFSATADNLNGGSVNLAFIGDLVMHIPVKLSARSHNKVNSKGKSINNLGFDTLFYPTAKIFKAHDATIANMEFPIVYPYRSRALNFNCRPQILPALKKSGINIVTIANNHTWDKRRKGLLKTIDHLQKNKMKFIGAGVNRNKARRGLIINKNNVKIGLLGYTRVFNGNYNNANPNYPYVNDFNKKRWVLEDIKRLKKKVDFLIIVVHWGTEYQTIPDLKDKKYAELYLNAGADMIIGHHPHVLQYIDEYKTRDNRNTFIVYSLGNFISNQAYYYRYHHPLRKGRQRDSVIMSLKLSKKRKFGLYRNSNNRITTFVSKIKFIPVWTVNKRNYKRKRIFIRTYPIIELLQSINKKLKKRPNTRRLLRRKRMLLKRIEHIKKLLFRKGKPSYVEFIENGLGITS